MSEVTTGGIASASTQQIPTSVTVRRDAPSTAARTVTRDETQTPNRTSPGSTTGTSRCEAHGCHGATAGSQSTVPTDQAMIRKGSPHSRAATIDDRP